MRRQQLHLPLESVEPGEETTYYFSKIGASVVIESETVYTKIKIEDDE